VWNESTIKSADYDEGKKIWSIEIVKPDGSTRLMHPRHFVVATGIGGGTPKMPKIPHAVGV
jgi:hemolysin-activating ACP:hemolysin acyltransferase